MAGAGNATTQTWLQRQEQLLALARLQLFFIGGAPRSGTTWLQYLLDSHPEISCSGEGLFMKHLAQPLERVMAERRNALAEKNRTVFRHAAGFALPGQDDTAQLTGSAILLALERQRAGKNCRAIGEKTPENVFFFPRLKQLFPQAKLIVIVRDPRDVLASAWHFFHPPRAGEDEVAARLEFVRTALPPIVSGTRATLEATKRYPSDCLVVTYETMLQDTTGVASRLFRFLGVSDQDPVVAGCVERTSFAALSGGRRAGDTQNGSFFRGGVSGDWRVTLSDAMNALILQELGWAFPSFGWEP